MTDLAQFIRARLAEDEQIARAASGGTVVGGRGAWSPSPAGDEWEASRSPEGDEELLVALRPGLPRPPDALTGLWGAVFSARDDDTEPDAWSPMPRFEHAARHDPARVLAELDAKRRILDLHQMDWRERPERGIGEADDPYCVACFGEGYPCATLRLFALPYADHPDYQPEWAPEA